MLEGWEGCARPVNTGRARQYDRRHGAGGYRGSRCPAHLQKMGQAAFPASSRQGKAAIVLLSKGLARHNTNAATLPALPPRPFAGVHPCQHECVQQEHRQHPMGEAAEPQGGVGHHHLPLLPQLGHIHTAHMDAYLLQPGNAEGLLGVGWGGSWEPLVRRLGDEVLQAAHLQGRTDSGSVQCLPQVHSVSVRGSLQQCCSVEHSVMRGSCLLQCLFPQENMLTLYLSVFIFPCCR